MEEKGEKEVLSDKAPATRSPSTSSITSCPPAVRLPPSSITALFVTEVVDV